MKANQAQHAVRRMCRLLEVSPSGFYAYVGRAPSKRAVSNKKLLDRIRRHHAASDGTYGAVRNRPPNRGDCSRRLVPPSDAFDSGRRRSLRRRFYDSTRTTRDSGTTPS